MINRQYYMDKLLGYKDKSVIKILTGIRRCGKSSMLTMMAEKLIDSGIKPENIIQINFESKKFRNIKNDDDFYNFVIAKIAKKGKTYLFFDEVQMVEQWEKAVNSFFVDFDVDIYITGSNAYFLSSELSTLLSGRYVEIKMLPLSFKEFLDFNSFDSSTTMDDKFQLYFKFGGMPIVSEFHYNDDKISEVLEGIFDTVIFKDVISRTKITDQLLLRKLIDFLANNIGSINSGNNISNCLINEGHLKSQQANKTIDSYILALENAFIFYPVKRYDIKGKALLKTLNKHYIVDIGLRHMLCGYRDTDRGHILENIVFLELIRRGYKVYIGKINNREVDFIAEKPNEKIYYQVAQNMPDKTTLDRELASLNLINDNYEKVILSMDKTPITYQNGIKIVNIIDFLLQQIS